MKKDFLILAIETSMDDTCAAVTINDQVISNIVASQVKFHEEFGGTVPHIARRKHQEWIDNTITEAMKRAKVVWEQIDAIAVTHGPGLAPSLEVGIAKAKELVSEWGKPLLAVNHMEGHLLSVMAKNSKGNGPMKDKKPKFPLLSFLISGGHTQIVLVKSIGEYEIVGETLDDAAGEAYDKVARMLKLGYPGGPLLSELAKKGEVRYQLPEPMVSRKDLNFSFSGLKTACMYYLKQNQPELTRQFCEDFSASFQNSVLKMMERRLNRAIEMYQPKMLWLGGGVVSNTEIRKKAREVAKKHEVETVIPFSEKLFTDNAAMIGVAGWYMTKRGEYCQNIADLDRVPNLRLGDR